jgi:hypothetical protein
VNAAPSTPRSTAPDETTSRAEAFRRNPDLDAWLARLNEVLAPSARLALTGHRMPRWPVILVVGCPRAGTTLVTQWLARSGRFAYPTNLIARFYAAPHLGAMIQRLLTDPDLRFRDELCDVGDAFGESPYASSIGKTRGLLAPHVFWHFWRRFFPEGKTQAFDEAALARVDGARFAAELAALESVLEKPVSMKALWIDWNIPFVSGLLEKAVFVHMERHPFYNVQSVLQARERFFGHREGWWSFRPPEYEALARRDPVAQVVGQVESMNRAVHEGLAALAPERRLHVAYEAFCREPAATWAALAERLGAQGFEPGPYDGPDRFETRDRVRVGAADQRAIVRAWRERTGAEIRP